MSSNRSQIQTMKRGYKGKQLCSGTIIAHTSHIWLSVVKFYKQICPLGQQLGILESMNKSQILGTICKHQFKKCKSCKDKLLQQVALRFSGWEAEDTNMLFQCF